MRSSNCFRKCWHDWINRYQTCTWQGKIIFVFRCCSPQRYTKESSLLCKLGAALIILLKKLLQIPTHEIRRVDIPVEVNATYVGIIMQKSESVIIIYRFTILFHILLICQDNLSENYDGSTTIKLEWIESKNFLKWTCLIHLSSVGVDQPYLEEMCDLDSSE